MNWLWKDGSIFEITIYSHVQSTVSKLLPILPLSLCTLGCWLTNNSVARSQVTPDNSVNTQVNQNGNVAEITGGNTQGSNLFHSFQDFSVPNGNEAFFDNASSVSNIFSRVTGGNVSNIDGVIRANGDANLFLVNPAGIIFGENSRLDIGGSFLGTTSDSILFSDGVEFSASDTQVNPVLTINAPIGLGFRDNPGEIVNNSLGEGLAVSQGNNLSLVGGNVSFTGGRVSAPGGIVNLGGLSAAGEIGITEEGSLSFAEGLARSNVSLTDGVIVDLTSDGGGLIAINADNLELTGASLFLANIGRGLGTENSTAGTITIDTTNILVDGESFVRANNLGIGTAGLININTDTLNVDNGSAITASTFGLGNAGDINVTAREIVINDEFSGIYSNVGLTNIVTRFAALESGEIVGNAGTISISTDTLDLIDGARITTTSIAQGDGGTVNINATGAVLYQGFGTTPVEFFGGGTVISGSFSQVQQDGIGDAGSVNITADSLDLLDVGAVLVDHSGIRGDAGDINLNITNNISLDNTGLILAQIQEDANGNGGDINITANSLSARGNSQILADTKGTGNAGNINIDLADTLSLDEQSIILTEVQPEGVGNAGNIDISARLVTLNDDSAIAGLTRGRGNGGNITITASDAVSLNNSAINSLVENQEQDDGTFSNAIGNGGDITITTGTLNLLDNSQITADTTGLLSPEDNPSNAGNIKIDTANDINLSNGSQIQSQTRGGAVGNAGNIQINAGGSLFSRGGNLILADSQAEGNGANITINVAEQILLEGREENGFPSQIVAGLTRETSNGQGGTIEINAGELIMRDTAFISSNTVAGSIGQSGNITLNVGNVDISENAFINAFTANNFDGGEISINAQTLNFSSGGKIFAASDGTGNAGNINLNVSDRLTFDNSVEATAELVEFPESDEISNTLQESPSGIYANTTENATGNGGNINIGLNSDVFAEQISIVNNAVIDVSSLGAGSGGSIFIAGQNLELDGDANISASTNFGQGGIVTLQIGDRLTLNNNSTISAEAFNNANGGNVNINSNQIIAFPNGNNDILASAEQGMGGNININTESLLGIQERDRNENTNDIDASSAFSLDGTVEVNVFNLDPIQGVTELPTNIVDAGETTAQACSNDGVAEGNSLTIAGKGGIMPRPDLPLTSNGIVIEGEIDRTIANIPQPIATNKGKIQPARGIKVTQDGTIILTAYRTDNSETRTAAIKENCGL